MLGCLLAAGVLVAGAGMAVLRTGAAPGSAPLVMSRKSGALFVRVGEALHPVTNLASARLILSPNSGPSRASTTSISTSTRPGRAQR